MSGRARRDEVAPSLFPFLAVLLCTMGALVLILMLVVSNAQATAKEIAASVEAEQVSEEMVALSNEMQKVRENQQKELDKKQGELAHVEDHINRLQNQIEDLVAKYEKLAEEKDKQNIEQADWETKKKELLDSIAKAEEELKEKEDEAKNKKPAYSIIPYQGPNGTSRRPIYLECVADGIVIQPDGFKLTLRDLKPPYGPGNPLDAVLRAIRSHLESIEATGGSTPYPLLIVRPDGIRTYAMARGAMASWDDQFGYELVGDDLDLKYPSFERPMNTELEKVVVQARERQIALIAAMPNRMRGMMDEEMGGDGDSWGPIEGNGDDLGDGTGEEGDLVFAEDAEMIQKLPDGAQLPSPGSGSGTGGMGAAGATSGLAMNQGVRPNSGNALNLGGLPNTGMPSGLTPGGGSGFSSGGVVGPQGYSMGSGSGSAGVGPSSLAQGGTRSGAMGLAGTNGQNITGSGANPTGTNGMPADGSEMGPGGANPDGLAGDASNPNAGRANDPSSKNGVANNGQTKAGEFGYATGSTGGDSGDSTSGQVAQDGKMSGQAPPEDSAYRDTRGGGGDSAMGPAGGEGGAGFTMTSKNASKASKPPSKEDDKNAKPQNNSESGPSGTGVVVSRGNDWTRQNIRGTAVERTIRLRCQEDRWVIQPEPGQQGTKTIFLRKGLVQARTDLSKALQGRVDSWGMALAGGYWKPKIVVTVDANAQQRYEQLQRVLQGSGIDVILEESQNGKKPQ